MVLQNGPNGIQRWRNLMMIKYEWGATVTKSGASSLSELDHMIVFYTFGLFDFQS